MDTLDCARYCQARPAAPLTAGARQPLQQRLSSAWEPSVASTGGFCASDWALLGGQKSSPVKIRLFKTGFLQVMI